MDENRKDSEPDIPTDSDELAGDKDRSDESGKKESAGQDAADSRDKPNPPYTTTVFKFTAPKFGAAGSGGLEIEPGLEKD
jgi:hypothetical protein